MTLSKNYDLDSSNVLGLALGGGGMKGWAHLGVISVLEEIGLRPAIVSGSSAGALMGAFYAFGYSLDQMMELMRGQRTMSLFSLRWDRQGLLSRRHFREYLQTHLEDCTFDRLKIPFFVTTTDLENGKEVVLSEGSVVDAIMASSALPGIFAPERIGGRLLIDGGLTNNIPVSALVNHGARFTIGVHLHRDISAMGSARRKRAVSDEMGVAAWSERLARRFKRDDDHALNVFEVLERSLAIAVSQLEAYRLLTYRPDVLIAPDVNEFRVLGFSNEKEEIFLRGVAAAESRRESLERLKAQIQRGQQSSGGSGIQPP